MAFTSVEEYNEEKYRHKFKLDDDGDSADVIFLYRSKRDMLRADVHYLISDTYTGYVHCLGVGCPVCARKKADGSMLIRKQNKFFIPVYNIYKEDPVTQQPGVIEFWERFYNKGFELQFDKEVFNISPNPSECVFKITRKGGFNDQNTRYSFVAVGRNTIATYDQILAKFNAKMPDYYENVVKAYSAAELTDMMQSSAPSSVSSMPEYIPMPRAGYQSSIPDTFVSAADVVGTTAISDTSDDAILSEFDNNDEDSGDLSNIDTPF